MEVTMPDDIKDVRKRKGTVYVCFERTENFKNNTKHNAFKNIMKR